MDPPASTLTRAALSTVRASDARPSAVPADEWIELDDDVAVQGRMHVPGGVALRHAPPDGGRMVRVFGGEALRRAVVDGFMALGAELRQDLQRPGGEARLDMEVHWPDGARAGGRLACDGPVVVHDDVVASCSIDGAAGVRIGRSVRLTGDLEAKGDVEVGTGSVLDGAVRCGGVLRLSDGAAVLGQVHCQSLMLGTGARVASRVAALARPVRPHVAWAATQAPRPTLRAPTAVPMPTEPAPILPEPAPVPVPAAAAPAPVEATATPASADRPDPSRRGPRPRRRIRTQRTGRGRPAPTEPTLTEAPQERRA